MSFNSSTISTMADSTDSQFGSDSNAVVGVVKEHPYLVGMALFGSAIAFQQLRRGNRPAVKVTASSAAPDASSGAQALAVDGNAPATSITTPTNGEQRSAPAPTAVAGSPVSNKNKKMKDKADGNQKSNYLGKTSSLMKWFLFFCSLTFLARNSAGDYLDSHPSKELRAEILLGVSQYAFGIMVTPTAFMIKAEDDPLLQQVSSDELALKVYVGLNYRSGKLSKPSALQDEPCIF